jgi:lipopolysaccharide/colanic/teichoic acid biosynthesis glycosyltransferase
VKHAPLASRQRSSLFLRRQFQLAGAIVFGAILPYVVRYFLKIDFNVLALLGSNALLGNVAAVLIAFWMRLSIETYPGIQRSHTLLPTTLVAHGLVLTFFVLTMLPYDRVGLALGFLLHLLWNYAVYFAGQRRFRPRIGIVPFGDAAKLARIDGVDWVPLSQPRIEDTARCTAIVADFSTDLPDAWEAFLADAALAGRIVYQVKHLAESLTGKVELTQLSENSFGMLVPDRGYFYLKSAMDFMAALAALPVVLPLLLVSAVAIRFDDGGPILFRQVRVGHAGEQITVYKFRTMRQVEIEDERAAAMTRQADDRITRVGAFLRRTRIDELPQIFNILKLEMSWIGPRPEAEVLSVWYTSELPFYRYRHVVKPGISGWAQVNQGHVAQVEDVHRKLQYDFYNIKYFSPWLDLLILLRTIKTVLTGFGAR